MTLTVTMSGGRCVLGGLAGQKLAGAPDGTGAGFDVLGLQPLVLEVLEMGLALPLEMLGGIGRHAGLSSQNIAESSPAATRG